MIAAATLAAMASAALGECIKALSVKMMEKLAGKATERITQRWNEAKIDWGTAFWGYLDQARRRNEKMKTLLYRNEPRLLYEFYEFVDLALDKKITHSRHVQDVLDAHGNNLIVTGMGGIGKTVMLKHFFLDCILEYETTGRVPVLVELRGLNDKPKDKVDVLDFIYEKMKEFHFRMEREYFDYSMEQGCYLILLDAFDELKEDLRATVTAQIQAMANQYSDNCFILTSRPAYGEFSFVGWSNFTELESKPLSKEQALSLVDKIETPYYDEAKKEGFYKELEGKLYQQYESFTSCPLLLTIMFLVYNSTSSLPTQLIDFYEQAFSVLYHEHDGDKAGNFKRELRCKELGLMQFKDMFAHFCFKSYMNKAYEFKQADLLNYLKDSKAKLGFGGTWDASDYMQDLLGAVCLLVKDGPVYRFIHRSFQEYFAACYMKTLPDEAQKKVFASLLLYPSTNLLRILLSLQPGRTYQNWLYPFYCAFRDDLEKKPGPWGYNYEYTYTCYMISGLHEKNIKKWSMLRSACNDMPGLQQSRIIISRYVNEWIAEYETNQKPIDDKDFLASL